MKRLEIFKAGTQTSASGETLAFSESDLQKTVAAYDPKIHEAPIVIGHPRDNAPAYGWVTGLDFSEDGTLHADAQQVEPEFAELVEKGRFKKRSASFYKPDSPNNPVPGVYYLRHVGFLGAQPPAVKGLADPEFKEGKIPDAVEFNDSPDDVVEFSDAYTMATLFRRMRDFFIEQFGGEKADSVLPGFLVEDLEEQARRQMEGSDDTNAPAFSEGKNQPTGDPEMKLTPEEIAALQAKAAKVDDLEAKVSSFTERENSIAEREKALARAEIEKSVDGLIETGKLIPAKRASMIDYLESLDNAAELEFSEGEGDKKTTVKLSQRAYMIEHLAKQPVAVDFGEHSADDDEGEGELSYSEIADEAKAYVARQQKAGRFVTTSQAVAAVKAGKHK